MSSSTSRHDSAAFVQGRSISPANRGTVCVAGIHGDPRVPAFDRT